MKNPAWNKIRFLPENFPGFWENSQVFVKKVDFQLQQPLNFYVILCN